MISNDPRLHLQSIRPASSLAITPSLPPPPETPSFMRVFLEVADGGGRSP